MPLEDNWNLEPTKDLPKGAKLLHFNLFNKPWYYKNVECERYFWNAAKGTGFYGDLQRTRQRFTEEMQKKDHEKVAALIEKAGKLSKVKKPIIKFEDK